MCSCRPSLQNAKNSFFTKKNREKKVVIERKLPVARHVYVLVLFGKPQNFENPKNPDKERKTSPLPTIHRRFVFFVIFSVPRDARTFLKNKNSQIKRTQVSVIGLIFQKQILFKNLPKNTKKIKK